MPKSILFCLFFIGTWSTAFSQIHNPVKWSHEYKQVNDTEYDLIFKAKIQDGWAIYSQYLESDDGPVRTSFEYDKGEHFSLKGKNKESGDRHEGYDNLFDMNVIKFKKKAIFTQRVVVKDFSKPITGYLEFMTCDDTKCLPPDQIDFEFIIENTKANASPPAKAEEKTKGNTEKKNNTPQTKDAKLNNLQNASDKAKDKIFQKKNKPSAKAKNNATAKNKKKDTPKEKIALSIPTDENEADKTTILDPVKWVLEAKKIDDDNYLLSFKAKMDKGWAIYSQYLESEDGPVPTSFTYNEGDHYMLIGKNKESGSDRHKGYDKLFDMELIKYKKKASFQQKVAIKDKSKPLNGYFEYMTCDDKRCLPPALVPFRFDAASMKTWLGDEVPEEKEAATAATATAGDTKGGLIDPYPAEINNVDLKNPAQDCGEVRQVKSDATLWGIFILGFFGGLLALLTPCVFPMIPLTVSFFTKGSENKKKGMTNAFLYGFFILLVYLLLSLPFHLMDSINPDILNEVSTNVWLNLFFFAIFIFFAFSFFGYYELTLPEKWTNKASSAEGAGGIIGIFFMALTLALVSFSCTGPILGSLLAGALTSDGGAMQLTAGMAGFGFALALPFALFAAFPSWMNSLPKSGGWLTTVKVVLGFLELALAFKFLSNADLVKKWGLLKIEPFLAIWIIIFVAMGIYLFGKIRFPHDSPNAKISPIRKGLGIASFAFALYLASGFMYNEKTQSFTPLSLLSGLAPPVGYSWIYPKHCPQNLDCFKDLDAGWAYAKEVNKPMLIDFTGHACVNCRKMEEHVWPEERVLKYLRDDYVLVSLYVDEKIDLPESEQITVQKPTGGKRKLRTTGNKWQHLQYKYFNANTQPQYALVSPNGTLLTTPVSYTPDVDEYANFLECGLQAFKNSKEGKKVLGGN
ncbi:MAG TPA: hypothetical protein ENJ45_01350 [Phaeodactylibacter sp.]|nr:hypothetical protein [Phaeodactylibacter sp.]